MVSIIACIGKNRELGKDNKLLWHIPEDLRRFREITTGHPVVMGRKTYRSIGKPLPDRTNIVITRDPDFREDGVIAVHSLDEAIRQAQSSPGSGEIFVIGGASVYAQAIKHADRLYLTLVDSDDPSADAFFPEYSRFTSVLSEESGRDSRLRYRYLILEK